MIFYKLKNVCARADICSNFCFKKLHFVRFKYLLRLILYLLSRDKGLVMKVWWSRHQFRRPQKAEKRPGLKRLWPRMFVSSLQATIRRAHIFQAPSQYWFCIYLRVSHNSEQHHPMNNYKKKGAQLSQVYTFSFQRSTTTKATTNIMNPYLEAY